MNSWTRTRSRAGLVGLAAVAVTAGALTPLAAGSAAAQEATPAPTAAPADTTAPTFTVSPTKDVAVDQALTVTFSEPVEGITSGTLRLRSTPSTVTPVGDDGTTFSVKANATMYAGAPYAVEASPKIVDAAGNAYVPQPVSLTTAPVVDDATAGLVLLGPWTKLAASGAVGGSYARSEPVPTRWSATHTLVYGSGAEVKGCVGPYNGIVEVWADGARVARVDTYRAATSCGVVLASGKLPGGAGLHLVEVRGMGERSGASRGTAMAVDAVTALP